MGQECTGVLWGYITPKGGSELSGARMYGCSMGLYNPKGWVRVKWGKNVRVFYGAI